MNFEEYKRYGYQSYTDFSKKISELLKEQLTKNSVNLHVQQIQSRAKSTTSVEQKLRNLNELDSKDIEKKVKDLAGCRIIFYSNSDVNKFLSSGILNENFEIDWKRTRFHQPGLNPTDANDFFTGLNYVIKLTEASTSIAELKKFSGMYCEIQVQTILNHAWSETAHDIIYKNSKLDKFGGLLITEIEGRMKSIMQNYLIPAGYEFQKVINDFERLTLGRKIFEDDILSSISECTDNNILYELLSKLNSYVIPNHNNLEAIHLEIRENIFKALTRARKRQSADINTPFGNTAGHTIVGLLSISIEILNKLSYLSESAVTETVEVICRLYESTDNSDEHKQLISFAKSFSRYELQICESVGPQVQKLIVDKISTFDNARLEKLQPILLEIIETLLSTEISGTTSNFNSITISQGVITTSQALQYIRLFCLKHLKKSFLSSSSVAKRKMLVLKMNAATILPNIGKYSNELLVNVLSNSADVIEFYNINSHLIDHEVLQEIEHQALWIYRRFHKLPDDLNSDENIFFHQKLLINNLKFFQQKINLNSEYFTYKVLVGYQSVFPFMWETENYELDQADSFRKNEIIKIVQQINAENSDYWKNIINTCLKTESKDLATFPYLFLFLEELGLKAPSIAIEYLESITENFTGCLTPLCVGLEKSNQIPYVDCLISKHIDNKTFLYDVASFLQISTSSDLTNLLRLLTASIDKNDIAVVVKVIETICKKFGTENESVLTDQFLLAVNYLSSKQSAVWVKAIWYQPNAKLLIRKLNPDQISILLNSLVISPSINHDDEKVLVLIAEIYPEKVIHYFEDRLDLELKNDSPNYEPIPHNFFELSKPLQVVKQYLVNSAFRRFKNDSKLFSFRDGKLLSVVFPEPKAELECELISFLELHINERICHEFLTQVICSYCFKNNSLIALSKKLIELLPIDDRLLTDISSALNSTGVISGEFGFVEVYKMKKQEITLWLDDPSEKIQTFASNRIAELDRIIAYEQRRAQEDVEMRKRDYGE